MIEATVVLCIVVGVIALGYLLFDLSSVFWPKIKANVLYCDVAAVRGNEQEVIYSLSTKFSYHYQDKEYVSTRTCLFGGIRDGSLLQLNMLKKRISGDSVARVCPLFPSFGIVLPAPTRQRMRYFSIAVLAIGIGIALVVHHELIGL
ncbi:hypothetical protein VST7929_03093 [Vibrio stylophorae]|uniref:DUF3592 domain-containing protein n=1 Tax=Vibrio stylophorae TaxID=659351 RepID=A0ABM8ZXQ8_9VIBR|nr:hypothetical protein [Vibrio stylophorae]CAH0535522.1 hypothetical protein VST7929_03093 [Vibrio stylophorae]